ncbi:hypothetical protein TNIN_443561 [Trichonephila inaurata madagascariensis]|uniref:Uncharacterized protein n=1 Tax=Trichonephila inaurata madagascariensis TaxID=2747483 RepID=A0A8X6I593_9ARAC|nr:hypothetical protein TNIN_443561 [Trichonephila inaurata madagascariensis]
MDMSASRTDVASSIKVSDLFTNEPLSFDANVATAYLDKCTTCVECEDLCDVLEEILLTLNDPDIENTPERLINLIQWTALKCSRKSIRLQNQDRNGRKLNTSLLRLGKTLGRKNRHARSARSQTTPPPAHIGDVESSMEEGETSAEESSEEKARRKVKPVVAASSSVAPVAGSVAAPGTSKEDDGFTAVSRKGRRIAPIVIDSQRNANELLDQLGKFCDTPLEGQYENGKLRVFPVSAEEHRLIQKFISDRVTRIWIYSQPYFPVEKQENKYQHATFLGNPPQMSC